MMRDLNYKQRQCLTPSIPLIRGELYYLPLTRGIEGVAFYTRSEYSFKPSQLFAG